MPGPGVSWTQSPLNERGGWSHLRKDPTSRDIILCILLLVFPYGTWGLSDWVGWRNEMPAILEITGIWFWFDTSSRRPKTVPSESGLLGVSWYLCWVTNHKHCLTPCYLMGEEFRQASVGILLLRASAEIIQWHSAGNGLFWRVWDSISHTQCFGCHGWWAGLSCVLRPWPEAQHRGLRTVLVLTQGLWVP